MGLDDILMVLTIGALIYVWVRRQRVPPSQRRRAMAVASRPMPRQATRQRPVGELLGLALRNDVARARRAVEGFYFALRGRLPMSSTAIAAPEDLSYQPLVLAPVPVPRTERPVPAASTEPRTEPAQAPEPAYRLRLARLEALGQLFAAGLAASEIEALQDGDKEAIAKALRCQVKAGVLASAMGGTRADRLAQIKAVVEQP